MSDDVTDRLMRDHPVTAARLCGCIKCDAADEIERLRAAGDALMRVMKRSETSSVEDTEWDEAIKVWKELRR